MKYILFVLLYGGSGPASTAAITTAEFEGEAACRAAAQQAHQQYQLDRVQVRIPMVTWCAPKGAPAGTP
jgi:hypothetical protein